MRHTHLDGSEEKGFTIVTADGWEMRLGLKELSRFLSLELTARRNVGLHTNRKVKKISDLRPAQWRYRAAAGRYPPMTKQKVLMSGYWQSFQENCLVAAIHVDTAARFTQHRGGFEKRNFRPCFGRYL